MKRSRYVRLTLMGAAAAGLSSCSEPQDSVSVFQSVAQCSSAGFDVALCKQEYSRALASHASLAPKYSNIGDCESDFGSDKCESINSGTRFIPLMAGFMMALPRTATYGYQTHYYNYGRPLYFPVDGSGYRTGDNRPVSKTTGDATIGRSTIRDKPNARTSTIRRGGFGQRAHRTTSRSRSFGFGG